MTPRAMLLGVLVASAAFSIAAADTDLKNCLRSYNTTILGLRDELGGNKVKLIDLSELENVVVAQLKLFYKGQARNVLQDKKRMLIIAYMKCNETEKPLLEELVKHLNKKYYDPILKIVIDARKVNDSSSLEKYIQESSRKVFTTMTIQLSETSSNSEGTILSDKVSNVIQTEYFNVSTKAKGNEYTEMNEIELVIKLKRGMPEVFEKIIELVKAAKKDCRLGERRIGPFCTWSDSKVTKYQKNSTFCSDKDPSYSEAGHELFEEAMQTSLKEDCSKTTIRHQLNQTIFYNCNEIEYNRKKNELMDKRTNSSLNTTQLTIKDMGKGGCGYIACKEVGDNNVLQIHISEGEASYLCVRRLG